ncbi:MAG: hypothetical protein IPJ77_13370 [Planctomycetes bacterium]|nr:hypothetical protein [Planctomycetota bacterium]
MGPLRTCACIGILLIPSACRTAGGSRVSSLDDDERRPAAAPEAIALSQVEPEFLPALESVQSAVHAGDDATARAILDRVLWRGPGGKSLAVARAFERVLDGRAALRELELVLEAAPESASGSLSEPVPNEEAPAPATREPGSEPVRERADERAHAEAPEDPKAPGSPGAASTSDTSGAQSTKPQPALSGLWLVARNRGEVPLVLAPGPATLVTTHQRLDVRAALSSTSEAHSFEHLKSLSVAPGEERRVRLSAFFLDPAPDAIAERLEFRLELRAGSIRRDGRELPAQRVVVRDLEVASLSRPLTERGASSGDELVALARAGRIERVAALDLALRLSRDARAGVLDALASLADALAEPDLEALVPALRWLAPDAEFVGDAEAWRAFLRGRSQRGARANLVLPRGG